MKPNFGFLLEDYADKPDQCINLLSSYLNKGHLGLMLGAGVSKALEMPNWKELVLGLSNEILGTTYDLKNDYTNERLKAITEQFKVKLGDEYFKATKEFLYRKVCFDFTTANIKLLVAIISLVVGKRRGNVQNIVTYNFDSVLEWYLEVNGLEVNVLYKERLLQRVADVNITHIHGYLPHDPKFGHDSDFLIFSQEEFEDRMVDENYWKDHLLEYFRQHIFLTVGMSAESISGDICPYLRRLLKWYEIEKVPLGRPFGFAFLTPGVSPELKEKMMKTGIIPCELEIDDIPIEIFNIARKALEKNAR